MTQEQKDLLLKDLCARLPYEVKVQFSYIDTSPAILKGIDKDLVECDIALCEIEDVKPYLFPLSSMTNELWVKEFGGFGITRDFFEYGPEILEFNDCNLDLSNMVGFINQLIRNHFDINGLIPMGLALDATGLDIY